MSLDSLISAYDVEIAFNLLLDRSPGEDGLEHFRRHAIDKGWSRRALRDCILGSLEYRTVNSGSGECLIDGGGFSFYVDAMEPEFGRAIVAGVQYEPHNRALLREILREGDVFVDVGANIGVLSLTARTAVGPSGKVICFEPMAANAALLIKSILHNDFNNMMLLPVALSDRVETFQLEGSSNGKLTTDGQGQKVTTAIGDKILANEPRIDFLKMDIEGHEPFALRGLAKTLDRHRPTILCEFNPYMLLNISHSDPGAFADQLFALTDEIRAIDYDGNSEIVMNSTELLNLCAAKSRFYVGQGRITEGFLHMDLLFKVLGSAMA